MTPRVVYWNNIPSPYMVERFNAVARRGYVTLEAWFSARTEADRSWTVDEASWDFAAVYLSGIDTGARRVALPTRLVVNQAPDLLVALHSEPLFLPAWAVARARGTRVALNVLVTFDSWIIRRRWKERLKNTIFPRVDGILTSGRDGKAFARRYGAQDDRIFYLPHVIDFEHYASASAINSAEREDQRKDLGLRGVTFMYAGRLFPGKGVNYLVDAFAVLQRRADEEISLLLAGDGPDERALRERCSREGVRNVIFAGFHQRDFLPRLYACADVFVFPTLGDPFGLVVEEAMACGLPVICTATAGEIRDRVEDGVNGFIVPPANSAELLDRMELLTRNPDLRRRIGDRGKRNVERHHPDRWAEKFEEAVHRILALPEGDEMRGGQAGNHRYP
jgi:glycosyltransferase involved in cell wall biosynthesis